MRDQVVKFLLDNTKFDVPEGVALSPPMVVPGTADPTPRTFAFILADNNLTVLDTNHPDRNEVSITGARPMFAVAKRSLRSMPRT